MIDIKYIELAMNTPDVFIANYLENGVFSELPKWCEIENNISEKFPYLTILYLLENEDGFSKDDFCNRYSEQLASENESLKSFVSNFSVFYNKEIHERNANLNRLNNHIDKLNEELSLKEIEYSGKIQELKDTIKKLEDEKLQLLKKNEETSNSNPSLQDEQISTINKEDSKTNNKTSNNSIKTFDINGIKLKMKYLEGGDVLFNDSSSLSGLKSHIDDFYYSEILVTQDLWDSVMEKNSDRIGISENQFVKNATIGMCLQFIDKINDITGEKFRLLTEKEWHYAALCQQKKNEAITAVGNMIISTSPIVSFFAKQKSKKLFENIKTSGEKNEEYFRINKSELGHIGELVLDLNAVCKRTSSKWDRKIGFSTLFNYSYRDGTIGIRLALSVNQSNTEYEFVDLGLSSSWSINENLTYYNNKRMPTPGETRELLTLHRTELEDGSVIRLTATNGNYIYMHSSWYKSCEFEGNKRFCYNPGNCMFNTIYDKDHYRRRFVKA